MPFSFNDGRFPSPSNPQFMEQQQQQQQQQQQRQQMQLQQPLDAPDTSSLQQQPLPRPASPNITTNSADNSCHLARANNTGISDRAELIERIKAGQNPTWIPNKNVQSRACPSYAKAHSFENPANSSACSSPTDTIQITRQPTHHD
jgi:transcription initiation factor TFIID subunit TAF12